MRSLRYSLSTHATGKLENDNFTIFDFENVVLTGAIVERQRDQTTGEVKTVVHGSALDGHHAESVVKISPSGKLCVITAYWID